MAAHFVLATLAATLAPTAAPAPVEVAYEQLRAGDNAAAIRRLENCSAEDRDDPARLINLGTAYARDGRRPDAEKMFRAAIASKQRYWLEMADGRWLDSREVAQIALERLHAGASVALR